MALVSAAVSAAVSAMAAPWGITHVSPLGGSTQGDVLLTLHGWGFDLSSFAELYARKLGVRREILLRTLWGEYFYQPKTKRILELNPDHALMPKLEKLFDADPKGDTLQEYAELLYSQAVLAEGGTLPNPARFSQLVADLMVRAGA